MARDKRYIFDDIQRLTKELKYESDYQNREVIKRSIKDLRDELCGKNKDYNELEVLNSMEF